MLCLSKYTLRNSARKHKLLTLIRKPELKLNWTRLPHVKCAVGKDHHREDPTQRTPGYGRRRRWRDELYALIYKVLKGEAELNHDQWKEE